MKRFLIPIVVLWSLKSSACTCIQVGRPDLERQIKFVNYIARCQVVRCDTFIMRDTVLSEGGEPWYLTYKVLRYSVKALEIFKDARNSKCDNYTILTMADRNECRANFQIGKEYLIYANWQKKLGDVQPERPEFLFTTSCEPNSPYSKKGARNIRRIIQKLRR